MIYQTVNEWEFIRAFDARKRSENFSINARRRLFEYYDQLSEDLGEDIELDPLAVCCDWSEYTETELIEQYGDCIEGDKDSDEFIEELIEELQDHTTIIHVEDRYLIQNF